MDTNDEKWMDDVLNSTKGSKRARPPKDLLSKIEARLDTLPAGKIISLTQQRLAIAAAVLLLVLNVLALRHYFNTQSLDATELAIDGNNPQQLISDFKLYD